MFGVVRLGEKEKLISLVNFFMFIVCCERNYLSMDKFYFFI